jgi:hypothetical protein
MRSDQSCLTRRQWLNRILSRSIMIRWAPRESRFLAHSRRFHRLRVVRNDKGCGEGEVYRSAEAPVPPKTLCLGLTLLLRLCRRSGCR